MWLWVKQDKKREESDQEGTRSENEESDNPDEMNTSLYQPSPDQGDRAIEDPREFVSWRSQNDPFCLIDFDRFLFSFYSLRSRRF